MKRTLLAALLMLSAPLSSARAAEASTWSDTFPARSLASYLGDTSARYMVVPAGAESPALTQAEQALTASLRASGKAQLVMSAQSLGPVSQLDDVSIARRCASFPVDRVLVLRLFPDPSGNLTQAVVASYDTAGQPLGSFSATAGSALVARRDEAPAKKDEAPAKKEAAPVRPASPAEAREQYALKHIGFEEFVAVSTRRGYVVSQWSVPYEGKYKKPLEGADFYQKVGRADLTSAYQDKMTLKVVTGLVGAGAMVGGGIFTGAAVLGEREKCDVFSNDFSDCLDRSGKEFDARFSRALGGIGIFAGGIGLLGVAILINPHPITPSEARELADGYNKKLAADLGLSDDGAPAAPDPSSIQVRFTPVVDHHGVGLRLSGSF
jgi:hypothetical protein